MLEGVNFLKPNSVSITNIVTLLRPNLNKLVALLGIFIKYKPSLSGDIVPEDSLPINLSDIDNWISCNLAVSYSWPTEMAMV